MQDRSDRPPLQLLDLHVRDTGQVNDPLQHHDRRDVRLERRNRRQLRALGALRKLTPNPRGQRFREKRSTEPRGAVRHTAWRAWRTDRGEDQVDSLSFIPQKGK